MQLKHRDHYVGEGYPDLFAWLGREKMIVELKAVSGELGASEEQQIKNYIKILKVKRGLLINFQQPGKNPRKTRVEIHERILCTELRRVRASSRARLLHTTSAAPTIQSKSFRRPARSAGRVCQKIPIPIKHQSL